MDEKLEVEIWSQLWPLPGTSIKCHNNASIFFHSGMKNINCSLIDPHQKYLTRLFHLMIYFYLESHLVRLERQRLARRTLKTSRLFSFSLMAVTTIRLSTTLWKAPQSLDRHCSNSHSLTSYKYKKAHVSKRIRPLKQKIINYHS